MEGEEIKIFRPLENFARLIHQNKSDLASRERETRADTAYTGWMGEMRDVGMESGVQWLAYQRAMRTIAGSTTVRFIVCYCLSRKNVHVGTLLHQCIVIQKNQSRWCN